MALMSRLRPFVLGACALVSVATLPTTTKAAEYFISNRAWDKVEGWEIAYNQDRNGCFAYAEYSGGYYIWFGFNGVDREGFLAISNEKWSSITANQSYDARYLFDGRRSWTGKGSGYVLKSSAGVDVGNLKIEFMRDFARSARVEVTLAGRKERLSLRGTRAALEEAYRCTAALAVNRPAPQAETPPETAPTPPPKKEAARTPAPEPEKKGGGLATGTGFFVNEDGHLVTNAHVVDGCSNATLRLTDGRQVPAAILARSKQNDLAILKADIKPDAFARFRGERGIRLGDDIIVFGFPLAGQLTITGNLTTGLVSALAGPDEDVSQMQITAPVQSGNSGGPVIDRAGNVVGVVVAKSNVLSRADNKVEVLQNINFAIKANIATLFLDANSVDYESQPSTETLSTADAADKAKSFTMLIACEPR